VIEPLLERSVREQAIPAIVELLRTFSGDAVDQALSHADAVMDPDLEEEELIDELTGLLHVAKYSDAFGFDLLGWLPPVKGEHPNAMCREVKSSADGTFHFSAGEWERATQFRDAGRGDTYSVLVIRRRSGRAPVPERLDLLVDPVTQCEQGSTTRQDEGTWSGTDPRLLKQRPRRVHTPQLPKRSIRRAARRARSALRRSWLQGREGEHLLTARRARPQRWLARIRLRPRWSDQSG
jgi:hypothetical protein